MDESRRPPRPGPWRVFLSHTSELREHPEDRSFVAAAEAAVIRAGHAVTDMAYFTARDSRPADHCAERVAEAQVYVGIIGHRYGAEVHDRPHQSHTELEFEVATRLGLHRLIFLVDERAPAPPAPGQPEEHRVRQQAFRRRLQEDAGLTVARIASPSELEVGLLQALAELRIESEVRAQPPEPRAGIPPRRIERLTGREHELARLRGRLTDNRCVSIHGLGGVGKTQLALAYLARQRTDYADGSYWLRGDSTAAFVGDLAALAWRLDLPERRFPEQDLQAHAVLRWLRRRDRWLLVVDDLDRSVLDTLRHWLPADLPGHILTTSRSPYGPVRMGVAPWSIEVATRFLLQRTGKQDEAAARTIAHVVGGLPLALEQAAAYLVENHWRSLAEYSELLESHMAELLTEGTSADYPLPVATTWKPTFERIEQEQPEAIGLMRLCSFLAPDDIPIGLLRGGSGQLPADLREALGDELRCDRMLRALCGYSLLERQGDSLRVHRLVQWVVRESLQVEERDLWLAAAIGLLRNAWPDGADARTEHWPLCVRLLPHVQAAERMDGDRDVEPRALAWLLSRTGRYLEVRGEVALARAAGEHALAIRRRVLGEADADTAESFNDLGHLLREHGDLARARSCLERALAIREARAGPEHPSTAESILDLAVLLRTEGRLAPARVLLERAAAIFERELGRDDARTARCLNHLGILLWHQGEHAAARSALDAALAARERIYGPRHLRTAETLVYVAHALIDDAQLEAATTLVERALSIQEELLGQDHPGSAIGLDTLGCISRQQGDLARARSLLERALAVKERTFGAEHLFTAISLQHLAMVDRDEGDPATALRLLQRAVAIWDRLGIHENRWALEGRQALEELRLAG